MRRQQINVRHIGANNETAGDSDDGMGMNDLESPSVAAGCMNRKIHTKTSSSRQELFKEEKRKRKKLW